MNKAETLFTWCKKNIQSINLWRVGGTTMKSKTYHYRNSSKTYHCRNSSKIQSKIVETEVKLIPSSHIYMTTHFSGLVQALQ
jgi:hypothetical protein